MNGFSHGHRFIQIIVRELNSGSLAAITCIPIGRARGVLDVLNWNRNSRAKLRPTRAGSKTPRADFCDTARQQAIRNRDFQSLGASAGAC
jgi:hypothetical protein